MLLTRENLWNRANAATMFLRRELVERVGAFDERLGLGSGGRTSSGEETDYLVRAVSSGARIGYDPTLVVLHDVREDDASIGLRDGASLGYLLRKHRYPPRTVARMLVRPAGGALVALLAPRREAGALLRSDVARARRGLRRREPLEQLGVTVEPRLEREAVDGSRPRRCSVRTGARRGRA